MSKVVMPVQAGIHGKGLSAGCRSFPWIPAYAGMTVLLFSFSLHAAELKMDRAVCDYVKKHTPDADVAFQPGADGVAPADINESPLNKDLEKDVAIKLTNQTAKVFGLDAAFPQIAVGNATVPLAEGETYIGYITLDKGKAFLNGKPLNPAQEDELAVLCIEREKR
jgi:hypothetical protein